jgi:hypothetical protein
MYITGIHKIHTHTHTHTQYSVVLHSLEAVELVHYWRRLFVPVEYHCVRSFSL